MDLTRIAKVCMWFVTPVAWRHEPLKAHCTCGRLVWDVGARKNLSGFQARIVCPECGHDWSRVPTLAWLLRFYARRLAKRHRYYGVRGMWRQTYPVYFWRFRGKAYEEPAQRRIITPEGNVVFEETGLGLSHNRA